MKKLIITCHPTPRSTEAGMKRILSAVRELAVKCGVGITWKEESEMHKRKYAMTSKMGKIIKAWVDEELPPGVVLMIPKEKFELLESIIADVLSNNCPEGGCHSSVFDEE